MRHFFDISSERSETRDTDGIELPDMTRVIHEAKRVLTRVAADEPLLASRLNLAVVVRDETGTEKFRLELTLALYQH